MPFQPGQVASPGTVYQPGQSGNPGGRPNMTPYAKRYLDRLVPKALEVLKNRLESEDERVSLMASAEVLNRRFGRPAQTVINLSEEPAEKKTSAELNAMLAGADANGTPYFEVTDEDGQADLFVDSDTE
jgi:hypothetical protein